MTRGRAGSGGFTLLEIAVALAVLGVGVVTCLQVFSGSLRLQDRASRESRAVMHARTAMDALFFGGEIVDHTEERTTAEGFKTRIVVRPAGADEGLSDRVLGFQSDMSLRYLEVDVTWQDGVGMKTYVLKSMRVAQESSE
jgi:prepilin-type N-terminal cleavage/methylation domain-containing protein